MLNRLNRILAACLLLTVFSAPAVAETYRLAIHPVLPGDLLERNFTPLANYLSERTGHQFEIVISPNYVPHWQRMLRGDPAEFVYDGAHVIGYLSRHRDFELIAKVEGAVSFTIVAHPDAPILEPEELVGQRVATIASPSLGAIALAQFFRNPMRQPVIITVADWVEAADLVVAGEVIGAVLPTPLLNRYPDLAVLSTTDPFPHVALAADPSIEPALFNEVSRLMIELGKSEEGQRILGGLNIGAFETADAKLYEPHSDMLERLYGVRKP